MTRRQSGLVAAMERIDKLRAQLQESKRALGILLYEPKTTTRHDKLTTVTQAFLNDR